jgi:hypothetical protein
LAYIPGAITPDAHAQNDGDGGAPPEEPMTLLPGHVLMLARSPGRRGMTVRHSAAVGPWRAFLGILDTG